MTADDHILVHRAAGVYGVQDREKYLSAGKRNRKRENILVIGKREFECGEQPCPNCPK
jgi:hypothetical protein